MFVRPGQSDSRDVLTEPDFFYYGLHNKGEKSVECTSTSLAKCAAGRSRLMDTDCVDTGSKEFFIRFDRMTGNRTVARNTA